MSQSLPTPVLTSDYLPTDQPILPRSRLHYQLSQLPRAINRDSLIYRRMTKTDLLDFHDLTREWFREHFCDEILETFLGVGALPRVLLETRGKI